LFRNCCEKSESIAENIPHVLKAFYHRVRPWGFWRPIHDLVAADHPEVQPNRQFRRDMINSAVGIVWQAALTAAGVLIVLQDMRGLAWALATIVATSLFLKWNWLDRIEDYPADYVLPADAGVPIAAHAPRSPLVKVAT
jgi:hypothetical protein